MNKVLSYDARASKCIPTRMHRHPHTCAQAPSHMHSHIWIHYIPHIFKHKAKVGLRDESLSSKSAILWSPLHIPAPRTQQQQQTWTEVQIPEPRKKQQWMWISPCAFNAQTVDGSHGLRMGRKSFFSSHHAHSWNLTDTVRRLEQNDVVCLHFAFSVEYPLSSSVLLWVKD